MSSSIEGAELPRLAVVGCGAAAERFYIPQLIRHPAFADRVTLVDRSPAQLEKMRARYGFRSAETDLADVLHRLDGVIITTPHQSHAPLALQCLVAGVDVLVEKPLACTRAEADEVVRAAADAGRTLMVNNTRRMFPSYRRVHQMIAAGELGAIERISINDGGPLEWESVGGLALGPAGDKHGVLMDRGAHSVDILCWWLGGEPALTHAHSDAWGGSDSVFDLGLASGDTTATLKLSRLYKLANNYEVCGRLATVSGDLFDWSSICLTHADGRTERLQVGRKGVMFDDFAGELLMNFIQARSGAAAPVFSGADVVASIRVIEQAYEQATRFDLPWYDAVMA